MNTKLTLRLDDRLIGRARAEARRRGKSVSRMVAEYFDLLGAEAPAGASLPPVTSSLVGILKGRAVSEQDYRQHLRGKHL